MADDTALLASLARLAPCPAPPRRRRRSGQPRGASVSETSWDEVFALAAPCLARRPLGPSDVPAIQRWRDADYVSTALPTVSVHVSAKRTVQMMSLVQPFGKLPELRWRRPWKEHNMSTHALLTHPVSAAGNASTGPWPYLFLPADALPDGLRNDLGRLVDLLGSPFLPAIETNVWAGAPNVSSPLHYDAAHNVYAQLVGVKRFVLLPPEEAPFLYVHPRLHPSTRQSQLDLGTSVAPDRFPRFHARRATYPPGRAPMMTEAVLRPGDRLYVPPYWWHRVSNEGEETAVSVAVYSLSTPMRAYSILKEHPLPSYLQRGCQARCYEGVCCLAATRAYLLALAALLPPGLGVTSTRDRSFSCMVARRCGCFPDADAFELREGLAADEGAAARGAALGDGAARGDGGGDGGGEDLTHGSSEPGVALVAELLQTRYTRGLDDVDVVDGMAAMVQAARARMRQKTSPPPPLLPAPAMNRLRAHARALRDGVGALPSRGDGVVSPAIWRTEIGSLIEDVAATTIGARDVEAALRWVAGRLHLE